MYTPTPVEIERRRRIKLAIWAYAYEIGNSPIVSDAEFDAEASIVDVNIKTGREDLDCFFKHVFSSDTGMWIHNHPELDKIEKLWYAYYKK